ncbi:MAG: adenylate/guanylate cyclase domain-containing protein [Spirochaetia bacterium]|nr:adenylate/guanylate cyclase domain-containing protein [Spirochaetia bacterium]
MKKIIESIFGPKISGVRVVPVKTKITIVFTIIILVSNLSSNYINLIFNRTELVKLMKQLLAKDLKDVYTFTNIQHEIYKMNGNLDEAITEIEKKGINELKNSKSIIIGVKPDSSILFQSTRLDKHIDKLADTASLKVIIDSARTVVVQNGDKAEEEKQAEGFITLNFNGNQYLAAYKYNKNWDVYLIRGEEVNEFYWAQRKNFIIISILILLITTASAWIGIVLLNKILRLIGILTKNIRHMVETQNLELIDMSGASNDDVSYLGFAFNSLSSTIDNLVNIFKKFANRDIVLKAYRDKEVKLEGIPKELTIMFSDIKSFTFITETLGTDIIKLLNLHYDNAIREIVKEDGVIGAIIGDALLAVFGALDEMENLGKNKSYQAVVASYKIQELAKNLRDSMTAKRDELIKHKKKLSKEEEKVYRAVLLEVGVGIDGGQVFYGTIGSYVRMTNTVIGDNVNAASRLEGLTRIYQLPVICSEYVKDDIESHVEGLPMYFMEIDTVQVKGKTTGKKIYWPILEQHYTTKLKKEVKAFSVGLKHYYDGDWKKAHTEFKKCSLTVSKEFLMRTATNKAPKDWDGIWQMTTK